MRRISIILPLYNSKEHIQKTLESVLAQTYPHWELVVVDDGSTDDSSEICRAIGDDRIVIYERLNTGPCRSRNFGISAATGDFIAFVDHDDIWLPTKLEAHLAHLDARPEVGVSYGPSQFIDAEGLSLGLYQAPKLTDLTTRDILCRNPVGNGSVPLIRQEVLEQVRFEVIRDGVAEAMYFDDECAG